MTSKYAYSYDREDYTGAYDTAEAALADAIRKSEGVASPPTTVYVGRLVQAEPQANDHARAIIDAMSQRAHVDFGEPASRYLRKVSEGQVKELNEAVEATILSWLKKNKLMPNFVRVIDIREYPVPFPGPGPTANAKGDAREVHDLGTSQGQDDSVL